MLETQLGGQNEDKRPPSDAWLGSMKSLTETLEGPNFLGKYNSIELQKHQNDEAEQKVPHRSQILSKRWTGHIIRLNSYVIERFSTLPFFSFGCSYR